MPLLWKQSLGKQADILFGKDEILTKMDKFATVQIGFMEDKKLLIKTENKFDITAKSVASYNHSFELLIKDLNRYRKNGYRVIVMSPSRTRAKRLAQDMRDQGITAIYTQDPYREVQPCEVLVYYGFINSSIRY